MIDVAEVWLWGEFVGALAFDESTHRSTFEYASNWHQRGLNIAPIHMPVSTQKYQFPSLSYPTFRGLPAIFADTLPDDFGNAVIDAWLAKQGRDSRSFNPLERLLYVGDRGMGAIEYQPATKVKQKPAKRLELDALVTMAQAVIDRRRQLSEVIDGKDQLDAMSAIFQVGTSAGGARAKALISINKERTEIHSGQVEAPEGFEHYLLKFDGVVEHRTDTEIFGDPKGYGRMEFAYYLMAKDSGITISPSELLIEGERAHFMTKRFDRLNNQKQHYLSLCAMDHADFKRPGEYSYEQLFSVARQLRLPRADAIEIFRRMVFNVLARNHDDHSKNTGFIMSREGEWRLAPAFDIAYSFKKDSPWVNSHQLTINGKRDHFILEDLLNVSKLISNFREAKDIIYETQDIVHQWSMYAERAGVFDSLTQEIQKNIRTL